jgi:hypothetical protein
VIFEDGVLSFAIDKVAFDKTSLLPDEVIYEYYLKKPSRPAPPTNRPTSSPTSPQGETQ